MDSQNPAPSDTSSSSHGPSAEQFGITLAVVLLPILYILSTGPVILANENGYFPSQVTRYLDTFYFPLIYLYDSWEPFEQFLDLYFKLLGVD